MSRIKAIQARIDAASPGPWRALTGLKQNDPRFGPHGAVPMLLANDESALCEFSPWLSTADRAFIVNARADVEHLCDEVRELRGLLRDVLTGEPAALMAATAYLNDPEKTT